MTTLTEKNRISWVDYAKGICIILVVLMHSTLGVEKAVEQVGWLHSFITWAAPFRMPDFFMISGLFLASRIAKPWNEYIDTKVVHFFYFYVLWMTIQYMTKGYGIYLETGLSGVMTKYALGFVQPFGTLWFIYLLPLFFVLTKLLVRVPNLVVLIGAAILEILPIHTGWLVIDETASRFVYFFAGYWLSHGIFAMATAFKSLSSTALLSSLFIWGVGNAWFVNNELSQLPFIGLSLGFVGAGAVVMMAVLAERISVAKVLRYCGQNSIVIYLSFFIFMAVSRGVMLKVWPEGDIGLISLVVTLTAVIGPLVLHRLIKDTRLNFLFVRPRWARLSSLPLNWHSASHDKPAQPPIKAKAR